MKTAPKTSTGGMALQGRNVIQISADKLSEIEYLLSQSIQGLHLLFDNKIIGKILKTPTEDIDFFNFDNVKRVQGILSDFISQKSIVEKQKFLKNLDEEAYELLVRTYFNIVDNAILESAKFKH
ncbi:MAG: hypothetical protein V4596_10730 [Bdellovibrionota bacterium]